MKVLLNMVLLAVVTICIGIIGVHRMWPLKFSMWIYMKRRPHIWKTRWQDDLRWTGCALILIAILALALWGAVQAAPLR